MRTAKENNDRINEAFDSLTPEELEETRISFDIAARLHDIIDEMGINQRELATLLGKKESEISRWLKGMHHFSTRTIAMLQVKLGSKVITVSEKEQEETIVPATNTAKRAQQNDPYANVADLKIVYPVNSTQRKSNTAA